MHVFTHLHTHLILAHLIRLTYVNTDTHSLGWRVEGSSERSDISSTKLYCCNIDGRGSVCVCVCVCVFKTVIVLPRGLYFSSP